MNATEINALVKKSQLKKIKFLKPWKVSLIENLFIF